MNRDRSAQGGDPDDGPLCSGREIRRALALHGGFHGRSVACTFPMSWTDLRALNVPPGNESERRAMIAQELETVYGAEEEPREFDFWELGLDGDGSQGSPETVNVLSIPRTKVTQLGESLAEAGLECRVLDGLPCALARALTLAVGRPSPEPLAAIDWGFANATFCVFREGRPQFSRNLRDCGAGSLLAQLGQTLGLSQLEAGDVLSRFGLPAPDRAMSSDDEIQEVVADVVAGQLRTLLEELAKTLAYLRAQRSELLPRQLWLFGGGAAVKNVAAFLAAKLEFPCEVWRLPEGGATSAAQGADGSEIFGPAAALSALAWTS